MENGDKRNAGAMLPSDLGETVAAFPTFGYATPSGHGWIVPLRGCAYKHGRRSLRQRILLRLLRQVMRASAADFASPLFESRVRDFLSPPARGKRLKLAWANGVNWVEVETARTGYFAHDLHLSTATVDGWQRSGVMQPHRINVSVLQEDDESPVAHCQVQLLPARGLSVISDIDDTIKHTGVHQRREMLANTFLREFVAVPGMARVYRGWAQGQAAFHFVSSSPWQLYPALAQHLNGEGFPHGAFHLRPFRLRDDMLRKVLLPLRSVKAKTLAGILETFPQREFVLVGDTAERDPELYAGLARRFPQQVKRIWLRSVPERPLAKRRLVKLRTLIDSGKVRFFEHAQELPAEPRG